MFETHTVEIEWAGRPLKLETGKIARQADGAVLATYGETVVLATVVSAKAPKPARISSRSPSTIRKRPTLPARFRGYFKREGRPSENETLVSRLIDRPIRPLFPEGYRTIPRYHHGHAALTSRTTRTSSRWSRPPLH